MRALVFLSVFVACASANSLLGSKACTWGPSYWCSHVKHARECQATTHCLQTVWKYQILKQTSNTEGCTFCQLIVSGIKDMLAKKEVEVDVSKALSEICKLLPNPDWQDQCSGIVQEYTPELIEMIEKDISADMVCATIGLCQGLEDTYSPYGQVATEDKVKSDCDDCKKFFQDVQKSVTSNETLDQLEQLINQTICSQLEALESTCNELVAEFLPQVLQFIADQIDPNIVCAVFGFCSTADHKTEIKHADIFKQIAKLSLGNGSSEECEICKDVLNQVVEMLQDKIIQEKVQDFLENQVCVNFGGFAVRCQELVQEYVPMAFEYLVNALDPKTFCETVGMCVTPSLQKSNIFDGTQQAQTVQAMKLVPAQEVVTTQQVKEVSSSLTCEICETVMGVVDAYLKDNRTVATVEDLIFEVCDRLSSKDLTAQCRQFVQMYGKMVLDLLADDLDPKKVCSALSLCSASFLDQLPDELKTTTCDLCIEVITLIENSLQNVSTEEIMADLEALCTYLPGNYSKLCAMYVDKFGPLIISLLKSKEDPKSICAFGKLCSIPPSHKPIMTVPIPEQLPASTVPSIECEVCDTVLIVMKEYLGNNATEEEIKDLLEKICSYVPSAFTAQCQALVEEYGDDIVKFFLQQLQPHQICMELGLCTEARSAKIPQMPEIMKPMDTLPILETQSKQASTVPSIECEVCDTVLIVMKEYLGNNATEDEIKQLLKTICTYVPSALTSECQALVDQYGDDIVKFLLQELQPHQICIELGLCTEGKSAKILQMSELMKPVDRLPILETQSNQGRQGTVECDDCTTIVTEVIRFIGQNKTQMEIEMALKEVCGQMPSTIATACQYLVDQYTQELINLLLLQLVPTVICQKLHLCPITMVKPLPHPVHIKLLKDNSGLKSAVNAGPTCVLCEFAMKELDNILQQNRSREAIKEALDRLCGMLPSSLSEECQSFVNEYSDEVIEMLIAGLNPQEICAKLGLCTADMLAKSAAVVHLLKEEPGLTSTVGAGTSCELCEHAMGYLDSILQQNRSKEAIKEAVERLCDMMPTSLTDECHSFVTEYGDEVIELLIAGLNPQEICAKLRLCSADMLAKSAAVVHLLKEEPGVKAGPACIICEFVLKELDMILKENSSEAEIKAALGKVCSLFPDTISAECLAFVNQYSDLIITELVNGLDPQKVCAAINLCSAKYSTSIKPMKATAGPVCVLCEFALKEIDNFLQGNTSQAAVEKALDRLCALLPDTISLECQNFVKMYGPQIIQLLVAGINPEKICKEVGLCTFQLKLQDNDAYCEMCKDFVAVIKEMSEQNKTTAEIEKFLKSLCDKLPDTVTVQCHTYIQSKVPDILKWLDEQLDPEQVCQKLQLCPGTTKAVADDTRLFFKPRDQRQLLGTNECTYGPAFWCASEENAKKCNAITHCQNHVWNN